MKKLFITGVALALTLLAQRAGVYQLGVFRATGTSNAIDFGNVYAHKHTVQAVVTGSPTTCNLQLEGTLDDITGSSVTWANLSGSFACTSSITFHVTDRPVRAIRVNVTALSGGTSPTVTLKYLGVQ